MSDDTVGIIGKLVTGLTGTVDVTITVSTGLGTAILTGSECEVTETCADDNSCGCRGSSCCTYKSLGCWGSSCCG